MITLPQGNHSDNAKQSLDQMQHFLKG